MSSEGNGRGSWSFLRRNTNNHNEATMKEHSIEENKETEELNMNNRQASTDAENSWNAPKHKSFHGPIGLSGPASIKFSPLAKHCSDKKQSYISFVSSTYTANENDLINKSSYAFRTGDQKILCTMDLEPIWREVEQRDIIDVSGICEGDMMYDSNLQNQDFVMKNYVMPMIVTSLPYQRDNVTMYHSSGDLENGHSSSTFDDFNKQKMSLEETLRRERQRIQSNGLTEYVWGTYSKHYSSPSVQQTPPDKTSEIPEYGLRVIVPLGGKIYVQDGVGIHATSPLRLVYEKSMLFEHSRSFGSAIGRDGSAIDPQLSPDGTMVAFVVGGEIFVQNINKNTEEYGPECTNMPIQITFGAEIDCNVKDETYKRTNSNIERNRKEKQRFGRAVSHGLADFVSQEEIERYQGFWWNEESNGILFVRLDESFVPLYRIPKESSNYEEHRYPFAGRSNPEISLGFVQIDRNSILKSLSNVECENSSREAWSNALWLEAPNDASEYLARVHWLPNSCVCVQWQNRTQSCLSLVMYDLRNGISVILHEEQSNLWINLHHMFEVLPKAICLSSTSVSDNNHTLETSLPNGSFSYIFASERTGFRHLYLYTYVGGETKATLLRAISGGEWMVESIVGVDVVNDLIYITGTYDSPLESHLYVLPFAGTSCSIFAKTRDNDSKSACLSNHENPISNLSTTYPEPVRLTLEDGMHHITMDEHCRLVIDTSSDLDRPTTTKVYSIHRDVRSQRDATSILKMHCVLYDSTIDYDSSKALIKPEILSFPTTDKADVLYAALYKPNSTHYCEGPYPLICAVYGGPNVQRVNRSWILTVDMRVQRLCSLGFAVLKCDNRGSSRRGTRFEGYLKKHGFGHVEVLDQVTAVRHLVMKGFVDPRRVGIYGWSYGGYLAAMCLCRAPDVFICAIAGAPVTSWDGYDTHYTERYLGLPDENGSKYETSSILTHVEHMSGKLLIIHGLLDENVHFRHSSRLVDVLRSKGKKYELLILPDERHSPKILRDRILMEKSICEFFVKNLTKTTFQDVI